MQYNPLDAGALVEGGKVIGQNSFKMAGQVYLHQIKPNKAGKMEISTMQPLNSASNRQLLLVASQYKILILDCQSFEKK